MAAAGQDRLAERLIGIEIIAEIDRIEPLDALAMGDEPAARGAAFAILLVVAVLRLHELRSQGQRPIMARRHDAGGQKGMKIFDGAIGAFARRAILARQLVRTEILRSVEGDQGPIAQAAQARQRSGPLHRRQRVVKQPVEAGGFDEIEHVADMIVAGDSRHAEQCLAIGAALPGARTELTLMRQKRRALHEERRKGRHPDVGHRQTRVQAPPLVRQAGAGLPNQSKQISQNRHTKLEIRNSRHAKALLHQNLSQGQNENCCEWTGKLAPHPLRPQTLYHPSYESIREGCVFEAFRKWLSWRTPKGRAMANDIATQSYKLTSDFALLVATYPVEFADTALLPASKEAMRTAFQMVWAISNQEMRSMAEILYPQLCRFQDGVGVVPVSPELPPDADPATADKKLRAVSRLGGQNQSRGG